MRLAVLAVFPLLLLPSAGCVHSRPLLVRNAFAESYWCPVNQIEVRGEPGNDQSYRVTGCGLEVTYICGGTSDSTECQARQRIEYEATDGTSHGAWLNEDPNANTSMSREAAIASAAHDLPCDRASVRIAGGDPSGLANVIEGCGQRVTYQIVDVADQPAAGPSEPVKKHKYVVVRRSPLAAPAPAPSASAAPAATPAPTPAPTPTPAPAPTPTAAPTPAPAPAPSAAPSSAPTPPSSGPLSTPR
jgi:hypothetical protein